MKLGGKGKAKNKTYWNYPAPQEGTYVIEITGVREAVNPKFPDDGERIVIDSVILGEVGNPYSRENVPVYPFQYEGEPEDYNFYGYRLNGLRTRFNFNPAVSPGGKEINGKPTKSSNLYNFLVKTIYGGKPIPEATLAKLQADEAFADAELGRLVGMQLVATLSRHDFKYSNGQPGAQINVKLDSILVASKKQAQPAYAPAQPLLTERQVKDADTSIIEEDTGNVVYGYYRPKADTNQLIESECEFIPQAEVVKGRLEKYGAVYSLAYNAKLDAAAEAEDDEDA